LDNDINLEKNTKQRQTLIKFVSIIDKKECEKEQEFIYLFTIDNYIVKIGGSRKSFQKRFGSYLCGHHIVERGKSGKHSITNGYIYNTFYFYLELNYKIEMYVYVLPQTNINVNILGKNIVLSTQTYHAYESVFLDEYKKKYKQLPYLNDNSDPKYK